MTKLGSLEKANKSTEDEAKELKMHYEHLIQDIRAENVVNVTEAERKESVRRMHMGQQLEQQLRTVQQRNKVIGANSEA